MKTMIKLLREPTADDKLGPQETACMNAVKRAVKTVGAQAERTAVIGELTSGNELQTRQEPARILSFYQPKFKEKGLIEIVKIAEPKPEPAPKATTAAKPAAAASPAKATAPAAGATA